MAGRAVDAEAVTLWLVSTRLLLLLSLATGILILVAFAVQLALLN